MNAEPITVRITRLNRYIIYSKIDFNGIIFNVMKHLFNDINLNLLTPSDKISIAFCSNYLVKAWGISINEAHERLIKYANNVDNSFCIIAKHDNCPIGMMTLFPQTKLTTDREYIPWAAGLYVVESFRRQGIGEQILELLCLKAKEFGYKKVHLATDKENLMLWYKSLVWSQVGKAFDNDHEYQVFRKEV